MCVSPHPAERTAGFSLVELLVVIIVIGILAAIAVPMFVNQQAKAHDAAVKSDLTSFAKDFRAAMVDRDWSTAPRIGFGYGDNRVLRGLREWRGPNSMFWGRRDSAGTIIYVAGTMQYLGEKSDGTELTHRGPEPDPTYTGPDPGTMSPRNWCLSMRNQEGQQKVFRYTAQDGLAPGDCVTP